MGKFAAILASMRAFPRLALICLGLYALPARAAEPAARLTKVTAAEGITEYRLDNGLRVLIFPDQSKPTLLVNITYLVGSRLEGYGETGMAHLLEHMQFKGTAAHPDVWKLLEDHGANFNGTTWWDRTNYFEEMPASPENLDFGLALEADRMINSKIAGADLAKEFSVVRNELERAENQPDVVLEDHMLAAAYQWHNYGKATIGAKSDIERVPVESLRAFYHRYYQPDNAILVVAGKFEPARALELVARYFGAIPRPARKLAPTWTIEPVQDGEREVVVRRNGDVAIVGLVYHGVAGADPDKVAEDAIVDILTNKPSGRLYRALVDKGLASEVSGNSYPMAEPGVMIFSAKVGKSGSVEQVRDIMTKTVESLGQAPITKDEIERWRAGFMRDLDLTLADTAKTGVVLSEFAAMGDWRLLFLTRDRVKTTTASDVARVAAQYLKRSNRTLGLFLPTRKPDRAPLPPAPDVAAMVRDYHGSATAEVGEAFVATVDNIESRTSRETLPGGLKLAMLPKRTKGGQVRLALTIRYGSETDLQGKVEAAAMLPEMLLRGTRKHSYAQLRDKLDQLEAEVTAMHGQGSPSTINVARFRVKTVRASLPAVIALVAEMLREPAFAAKDFSALRKEILTHLEEQLSDPTVNASIALMRDLLPYPAGDLRYIPTIAETIERLRKVTPAELAALHKRLWGASSAQVSVVGDFDPATTKAEIVKELTAWKSPQPYHRITLPFHPNPPDDRVIDTPDKEMALVATGQALELRDDDPAYPALHLFNYMAGGSANSRIFLQLRQRQGLSYGAYSQLLAHPIEKSGFFLAAALTAPANLNKAMTALLAEIGKMVKSGFRDAEVGEAQKSYAKAWQGQLADDDFVLGELDQGLFLDRTFAYWKDLNRKIGSLTANQINATVRQFIDPAKLSVVRAGDLTKEKAAASVTPATRPAATPAVTPATRPAATPAVTPAAQPATGPAAAPALPPAATPAATPAAPASR
jgi:zinc protease